MIRRIFQVEVMPLEEDPDRCVVWVRNPRTGKVVAALVDEDSEPWLAE